MPADERLATLRMKLASAKASYSSLVKIATRSEVDANKVRAYVQNSQARLNEVEQEAKLALEDLKKVRNRLPSRLRPLKKRYVN